jgi:hypothetical protein
MLTTLGLATFLKLALTNPEFRAEHDQKKFLSAPRKVGLIFRLRP